MRKHMEKIDSNSIIRECQMVKLVKAKLRKIIELNTELDNTESLEETNAMTSYDELSEIKLKILKEKRKKHERNNIKVSGKKV